MVANEVKELAKGTARATEEIGQKIEAIQNDTQGAVEAIAQIRNIIQEVNDISNNIAAAVEEQTVTTNEISRNASRSRRRNGADRAQHFRRRHGGAGHHQGRRRYPDRRTRTQRDGCGTAEPGGPLPLLSRTGGSVMSRALVVDDSRAMRMILSKTLVESGFEVVQAANGREALETMDREGLTISLVLLDWNMPEISGIEVLEKLRSRSEFNGVRMVMVTTETEIEQMARALEAGADEYVMKPFTREALEDKLRLIGVLP